MALPPKLCIRGGGVTQAQQTFGDTACNANLTRACVGAPVRMTVTKDTSRGLSNGTQGHITGFNIRDGSVTGVKVCIAMQVDTTIHRYKVAEKTVDSKWTEVYSFGLALAYATTVHACQGQSLTCPIVLDIDCFAIGQGYVAISRSTARNLIQSIQKLTVQDLAVVDLEAFYAAMP